MTSLHLCPVNDATLVWPLARGVANAIGPDTVVFRPIVDAEAVAKPWGVVADECVDSPQTAMADIVRAHAELAATGLPVLLVGDSGKRLLGPAAFSWQVRVAANVAAPLLLVEAVGEPSTLRSRLRAAIAEARSHHAQVASAIVVGHVPAGSTTLGEIDGVPVQVVDRKARVVTGDQGMHAVLDSLTSDSVLVFDSSDAQTPLAVALAAAAGEVTPPAAAIAAGSAPVAPGVAKIWAETLPDLQLESVPATPETVVDAFLGAPLDLSRTMATVAHLDSLPVTPVAFEQRLLRRARSLDRHIVLPEGDDERILCAAERLLAERVCRLTVLGNPDSIRGRATELGLNLDGVELMDPATSELRFGFAERYATLRAKRGVTIEQARERMLDVSYFGTMMVLEGYADGMVSGAAHTTAHTIRPALEVIKTRPGVSVVSSVFLMCLADKVLVYGDCAVNPNPTPEQLAEIAVSSAATARQFGIDPRVAMLSYSTGNSGSGPDVDAVLSATELVRRTAPELVVDGPLQYDAAVDEIVGTKKMPGSSVAGRATVLVFPDLQAGNIAYKAVQRSADALALGPVLQGLNKPINDLSRGALVQDIINTVAITAIQAGEH